MAFLCRPADGIEHQEIFRVSVALFDRLTDAFLDFLGFAFQHGRLIRHSDALQVEIGVKAWGNGVGKFLQKLLAISFAGNVAANEVGVFQCENDEIMTSSIFAECA